MLHTLQPIAAPGAAGNLSSLHHPSCNASHTDPHHIPLSPPAPAAQPAAGRLSPQLLAPTSLCLLPISAPRRSPRLGLGDGLSPGMCSFTHPLFFSAWRLGIKKQNNT